MYNLKQWNENIRARWKFSQKLCISYTGPSGTQVKFKVLCEISHQALQIGLHMLSNFKYVKYVKIFQKCY